jgi:hypothetical protein
MDAAPNTLTLYPYLKDSCWVFDDARTGLKEEAFVLGATEMITRVIASKSIPNADYGFALTFAAEPFAGYDVELRWLRADPAGGNWYEGDVVGKRMEAWLCPALLLYFHTAPIKIFVRCEALPPGIEPIWSPPPGVSGRRFVEASADGGTPGLVAGENRREQPVNGERFFVPTQPTLIETFRAYRSHLEKIAEAKGATLDPAWYDDGPDTAPHLYKDQPHLKRKGTLDDVDPEA